MKIGVLASILEKDATELAKALNLAEGVDTLDSDILETTLKTQIEDLKKSVKSNAKKEAFGFAERQVKTEIEKRLKESFGVDGETLDDVFESLKSKVGKPADDSKLQRELEIYKGKYQNIENEFKTFKSQIEAREKESVIFSKLESVLSESFDITGKEKLKKIAFSDFAKSYSFEDIDGEIHLADPATKKPIFKDFGTVATEYFKDVFPAKTPNSKAPTTPPQFDPAKAREIPNEMPQLLEAFIKEKDPAQKALIKQKIEALKKK